MGKNMRARVKNANALKMVYTHGKKRNAIANAVVQEGKGTITVNKIVKYVAANNNTYSFEAKIFFELKTSARDNPPFRFPHVIKVKYSFQLYPPGIDCPFGINNGIPTPENLAQSEHITDITPISNKIQVNSIFNTTKPINTNNIPFK